MVPSVLRIIPSLHSYFDGKVGLPVVFHIFCLFESLSTKVAIEECGIFVLMMGPFVNK